MSLPVVLLPEARTEFDEAFDWYERQKTGLEVSFANDVQRVFDRISANPECMGSSVRMCTRPESGGPHIRSITALRRRGSLSWPSSMASEILASGRRESDPSLPPIRRDEEEKWYRFCFPEEKMN